MASRKYDLTAMETFIAELDSRISQLETHVTSVSNSAKVVRQSYEGITSDNFWETQSTWGQQAEKDLEDMRALRKQVDTTYRNYVAAERAGMEMFGGAAQRT
jgi:uncharacterized protein YukE